MTALGHRIRILLAVTLIAVPLSAQTAEERIADLEKRLDTLMQQASEIRKELDTLKGASTDLTAVDLAQVQPLEQQPVAAAAKVLNPDISVVGTMVGHLGNDNPLELGEARSPLEFAESELAFEAFIDPYARGRFFIAVGPEEVDLEEGYAQFVTLPHGFTAKAGKLKTLFGKANTWHTHTRPWVDQPLMIHNFFSDEGLADAGISVSRSIGNPWGAFIEATGEVFSGNAEGVFERQASNDLFYSAHVKLFRDIGENSNLEVGTSWSRGTLPEAGGTSRFAGLDVTYRWKPLERALYNSLILRFEGLANRRAGMEDTLYGYYASADYQLARRWFAGLRVDRADRDVLTDRGVSALLTFWPSEFSQIRGQFRRTTYGGAEAVNEFLLQLQFAIGAHGAHVF
jgi:hypothetical protein